VSGPEVTWEDVLTQVINESHAVTGDQMSEMTDRAVRPLGLTAEVLAVDLAQRMLARVGKEQQPDQTGMRSCAARPMCSDP
jgi:hypothetical protein